LSYNGTGTNPKDILFKTSPERVAHLTHEFGQVGHGFSTQDVINASAATLITCMRQTYKTRAEAEAQFNEIYGRMKQILVDHYDGTLNRKAGLFPFNQEIKPDIIVVKPKFAN